MQLLVKNESKLECTRSLHPAPKHQRNQLLKNQDSKIASYFCDNGIAFKNAASSRLALVIEESMKLARQILFKVTRCLINSNLRGTPWQCIWGHWETCCSDSCSSNEIWSNTIACQRAQDVCCWDSEDVYPVWLVLPSSGVVPTPVRLTSAIPMNYQITESPNCTGAHFDWIANC